MLHHFLAWWGQQLLALVPERLRRTQKRRRDALIAEAQPGAAPPGVVLVARRRGQDLPLGRFGFDEAGLGAMRQALARRARPAEVVLQAPPGALLEREVVLPLAAEREAGRVLGYEMDRLTPFAAGDVFWAWAVDRRDRAQERLHLRLSLVPKVAVAAAVEALDRAGAAPTLLEAGAPDGAVRLLPIRPTAARAGRWQRPAAALAGAVCAALAVAAGVVPFVRQSVQAGEVEAEIALLRPQVDRAEALRRRIADARAGGDALAAQRARVGDALEMLAVLTEALPDDTYLTDLALRGRVATMSGQSDAAARLIAVLSSTPAIRDPAFTAPVTRNQVGTGEGFSIRAEFGP